ncbi:hypothetical protein DIS24_g8230 [Lasiodiplodia hormozganensis]|uniref:Uncharacterized protein n=1 Tax=Lasiodiplodia hormozganensis TaxID=869390 RepID=A0AA39Y3P0_9PEZI|nr:hypothetical protein DIS24_g8230 [Lasiodiplodia hormozganensis]
MTAHGDPAVGHLVEQLAIGFDALSSEYRILHDRHRELENKLVWAKQQYLDLLKRFTPDIALQDHKVFVQSLEEVERHGEGGPLDWLDALAQSNDGDRRTGAYIIRQAERARDQLKYYRPLQSPLKEAEGVKIWNGRTGDRASDRISKLENPSVSGSAQAVCPIRFMDDHSPEEIAKYFENHKHELPRSHEVCIKRFQSNAESIRQLDAKYGNLVNMIQGLGEKHQPMLKESPTDEDAVVETESGGRVADWAKAVSTSAQAGGEASPDPEQPLPEEEERQPHFDRPLKDIRVGESPSRPWGITVPAAYNKPPSIATDGVATASPVQDSPPAPPVPPVAENRKPGKCPFDHTKLRGGPPVAPKVEGKPDPEPEQKTLRPDAPTIQPPQDETIPGPNIIKPGQSSSHPPQMVFTGPVFIGYSMEQALALLQQTNMVGKAG